MLVGTIRHDPIVISRSTVENKDYLLESLQRIVLLSMENKRMRSLNTELNALNKNQQNLIDEQNLKLQKTAILQKENSKLETENADFIERIDSYLEERSRMLKEIEQLHLKNIEVTKQMNDQIKLLATENESLKCSFGQEQQRFNQEMSNLNREYERATHSLNVNEGERHSLKGRLSEAIANAQAGQQEMATTKGNLDAEMLALRSNVLNKDRQLESGYIEYEKLVQDLGQKNGEVKNLESEIDNMSTQIHKMMREMKNSDQEIEDLTQDKVKLEAEKNKIQEKMLSMEKTLDEIREDNTAEILGRDLQMANSKISSLKREIDQKDHHIQQGLDSIQELNDQVRASKEKETQLLNEKQTLQVNLEGQTREVESLKAKIGHLKDTIETNNQEIDELREQEKEYVALQKEMHVMGMDVQGKEQQLKVLGDTLQLRDTELSRMQEHVVGIGAELNQKESDLESRLVELQTMSGKCQDSESSKQQLMQDLATHCAKIVELEQKQPDMENQLLKMNGDLALAVQDRERLSEQLETSKKLVNGSGSDLNQLRTDYSDLLCKKQEFELKSREAEAQVFGLSNELQIEKQQNSTLKQDIDSVSNKLQKVNLDLNTQKKRVRDLEGDNGRIRQENQILVNEKVPSLTNEKAELQRLFNEKQTRVRNMEEELRNSSIENKNLGSQNTELARKVLAFEKEGADINFRLGSLQQKDADIQEILSKKVGECEKFEKSYQELSANYNSLKKQSSSSSEALTKKVESLESLSEKLQNENSDLKDSLKKSQNQISEQTKQLGLIQKEAESLRSEYKILGVERDALKSRNVDLGTQIQRNVGEFSGKDDVIRKLRDQLDSSDRQTRDLKAEVSRSEQLISDLKNKIDALRTSVEKKDNLEDKLRLQIQEGRDKILAADKELFQNKTTASALSNTIADQTIKISSLRDDMKSLKEERTRLMQQNAQLTQQAGTLKLENDSNKQSLGNLSGDREQLKVDCKASQEQIRALTLENGTLTNQIKRLEIDLDNMAARLRDLEGQLTLRAEGHSTEMEKILEQRSKVMDELDSLKILHKQLEDENVFLKGEIDELDAAITIKHEEMEGLIKSNSSIEEDQSKIVEEVEKLRTLNIDLEKRLSIFMNDRRDYEERIKSLQTGSLAEKRILDKELASLRAENERRGNDLRIKTTSQKSHLDEISRLKRQLNDTGSFKQKELKDLNYKLSGQQSEREALKSKVDSLCREVASWKEKYQNIEPKSRQLEETNRILKLEIEKLSKELDSKMREADLSKKRYDSEIVKNTMDLQNARSQINELNSQNQLLSERSLDEQSVFQQQEQQKTERFKQQIITLERDNQGLTRELEDLKSIRLPQIEDDLKRRSQDLLAAEEKLRQIQRERDDIQRQKDFSLQDVESLKARISDLTANNSSLTSEIHQKSSRMISLEQGISSNKNSQMDSLRKLQNENRTLGDDKKRLEGLVTQQKQKIRDQSDEIQTLRREIQKLQTDINSLSRDKASMASKMAGLEADLSRLSHEKQRDKDTIVDLRQRVKQLEEELAQKNRDFQFLMKDSQELVQKWTKQNGKLTDQNNELEHLLDDKRIELVKYAKEKETLAIRLTLAYAELERLTKNNGGTTSLTKISSKY